MNGFDRATLFVQPGIMLLINWRFDDVIEFSDCKLDEINPGGGSTPSAISMARCNRAFLSQSSVENSSGNLKKKACFKFLICHHCNSRIELNELPLILLIHCNNDHVSAICAD